MTALASHEGFVAATDSGLVEQVLLNDWPPALQRGLQLAGSRIDAGDLDSDLCQDLLSSESPPASAADTRVIVAHSLGAVVPCEALCANPDWPVYPQLLLRPPKAPTRRR